MGRPSTVGASTWTPAARRLVEKMRVSAARDLLLTQEEQVARNFVSQLITYATGAEVQFADRPEVERILANIKKITTLYGSYFIA